MYTLMDAHPLTLIIIMSSVMVTPFYLLATYVFSGASPTKGLILGALFLVWGAVMAWFVLAQVHAQEVVQDDRDIGRAFA